MKKEIPQYDAAINLPFDWSAVPGANEYDNDSGSKHGGNKSSWKTDGRGG
jgi:hypothetical protein